MAAPGAKPMLDANGEPMGPKTQDMMSNPGPRASLAENLMMGIMKAQRGIVYSNLDYRNHR